MKRFSNSAAKKLRHYVYVLVDPYHADTPEMIMSKKKAPKNKTTKKKTMKKNEEEFDLINAACAQYDSPLQITNLFSKDFSIDEQDENGRTPLMISAMWGSSSVMEFLLEKGADKTIKDHDRNDVVFFVKHSTFPRDEDKNEGRDG